MPKTNQQQWNSQADTDIKAAFSRIDVLEHAFKGLLAVLPPTTVERAKEHAYDSFEESLAAANPVGSSGKNAGWYSLCSLFGERAED